MLFFLAVACITSQPEDAFHLVPTKATAALKDPAAQTGKDLALVHSVTMVVE